MDNKLSTINVVEVLDGTIQNLLAFFDCTAGQIDAEILFEKIARENEFSRDEIEEGLVKGELSHSENSYRLYIVRSS